MRIVCIADLQSLCSDVTPEMLPEGDMLLVAGDLCGWGTTSELLQFNKWLGELDYKYKIVVAGNHDICLETLDGHKFITNATYLQDELIEIEGLRIYGSPACDMNTLYHQTPFNAFSEATYVMTAAEKIPENLDILLVHGPPFGLLDKTLAGSSVGSKHLRQAILDKKPKYYVCGHIHEAHGTEQFHDTTVINAALCSRYNQMNKEDGTLFYEPIVIEI